jgi:hypothetical protein
MIEVFVFRAHYKNANAAAAATTAVLQAFGTIAQFEQMFGGSMTFGRPPSRPDYLGVWGSRNVSRFRRLLRERVGDLVIIHAAPPADHSVSTVTGERPTQSERTSFEKKLPTAPDGHKAAH